MSKKLSISIEAFASKAQIRIVGRISDWRNSSDDFETKVNDLIAGGVQDVDLYIKSEGGSVVEANEITNIIKKFPGTVTGTGGAMVASAATYIAINCASFSMPSNGLFMIHKPMLFTEGNVDQLESDIKMMKTLTDNYRKAYAKKTGKTDEQIDQLWANDCWMGASEAKQLGFIDSISDEETPDEDTMQAVRSIKYDKMPTALLEFTTQNQPKNDNMNIKAIAVALALAESVTEAEVMAHLTALKAKADKADEYKQKLDQAEAQAQTDKIKAMLDKAIADKKVSPGERAHLEKLAAADFESVSAMIAAKPVISKVSTEVVSTSTAAEDRSGWKYSDYQEKDPKALAAMASDDPTSYKSLFRAHYGVDYTG